MPDHRIHTEADLERGIDALLAADPRFAALIAKAGRPPLRRRPGGFAGLASTVVSQQLSTASAGAIWGRLSAAFDPVEPTAIIRARKERLARIGHEPEARPLRPHLTLVRCTSPTDARAPIAAFGSDPVGAAWSVDALTVYESQLRREGARYVERASVLLPG